MVALPDYQTNYLNDQISVDYRMFFFGQPNPNPTLTPNSLILTDGTDAGTTTYGGVFGLPETYVAVNDTVYFVATTSAEGSELWHATTPMMLARATRHPPPPW